jgi:NADH-quinone oxidoreductase subunit N
VIAGGSAEADDEARAAGREPGASSTIVESDFETSEAVRRTLRQPEVLFVALACALATIVFGIYPEPLFNVAKDAGDAITSLI